MDASSLPDFSNPFTSCSNGIPSMTGAASSFCNFIPQIGTVITDTDAILSNFTAENLENLDVPSGGSSQNVIDKAFGDIEGLILDPIFDEVAEGASSLVNDVIQARFRVPGQPGVCIPESNDPCIANPNGPGCVCPVDPYRSNENGCGLPVANIDLYIYNTSGTELTLTTDTIALELNGQNISLPNQTRWLRRLPSTIPANSSTPAFGRAAVNGDVLCYLGQSTMRVNVVYSETNNSNNNVTIDVRRVAPATADVGCLGQGCPSGFEAVSENTVTLSNSNSGSLSASLRQSPAQTQVQININANGSGGNGGNGGNNEGNNAILIGVIIGAVILFIIFLILIFVLI